MKKERLNLVGRVFGKLTVISEEKENKPHKKHTGTWWNCLCVCGNVKTITSSQLGMGRTKSCGCYTKQFAKETAATGLWKVKKTHGLSKTKEYKIWRGLRDRCYSKTHHAYHYYGGRGITVCDEWRDDFTAFLKDMGKKPEGKYSLDRIDNNKGYSPENCRWATDSEQGLNRRNNRMISFKGELIPLSKVAQDNGLTFAFLASRLNRGMSAEDAVYKPKTPYNISRDKWPDQNYQLPAESTTISIESKRQE